jgi:hypothetical protein
MNDSCVGARILQRLDTSYTTHLIAIHPSGVTARVPNKEHHHFCRRFITAATTTSTVTEITNKYN